MYRKQDRTDKEEFSSVDRNALDKIGIVEWIEAMIQKRVQLDKIQKD